MVNILDVDLDYEKIPWEGPGEIPEGYFKLGDWLATIFKGQEILMEKYQEIERRNGAIVVEKEMHGELDDRKVQMRIKDLAYRIVEEISEATNCLRQKPWSESFTATDRDHFFEELSDALHFFVELCITAGLSADDLFTLYWKKHEVNKFRQRSGY
jgi:hypothetical protein